MTNKINQQEIVKLVVILFSVILGAAIIFSIYFMMSNSNPFDPKDNVTTIIIDWYYPELEELAGSSDLIVIATATDKLTVWDTADGTKPAWPNISDTTIYTCYFFEETEILKGDAAEIWGRVPGGTIDGYTLDARDVPEPEIGETVLLFLKTNVVDGELISWYHVGMPNVFYETESGTFVNPHYGEITMEEVKALSHIE